MESPHLLPHHQKLLVTRAVSAEVAAARGYRSVGKAKARDLGFTGSQARSGLLIPLWHVDGQPGGYQLRPDDPRTTKDGKPIKYETPKGQRNILDVPPTVQNELHKARQGVLITEGAFKADALASLGIPCINLTGVYGWRGRNEDGGYTALVDWESINLKGSIFVVAFDSDILVKEEVHQGLARLTRFLEGRGAARVRVLVVPQLLSGKTGIDDYIYENGATVEDLARLVVDELPAPPTTGQDIQDGPVPELGPLLDEVATFYRRFVVLTVPQADTLALWSAHTHAIGAAETTPYINVSSPEKESGKTRTGEVAATIVGSPLSAESISPAALARSVESGVTVILDEVDTIFGKGNGTPSETKEMLRGVLDSGWRRGGRYVRMVGQGANMTPQGFATFGAKMLIGIGTIPGTLGSRSVRIALRRRRRDTEHIERFRTRKVTPEGNALSGQLAAWASIAMEKLRTAEPELPADLSDRMQDSWEPLLAIADLAGGTWPSRAREAAKRLSGDGATEDESTGVRLLSDLRELFMTEPEDTTTVSLLGYLIKREESAWGTWYKGNGLRAHDLARMLRPYNIHPKNLRRGGSVLKGYSPADFIDAFSRYLPPLEEKAATTLQAYLSQLVADASQNGHLEGGVADGSQIGTSYGSSGVAEERPQNGNATMSVHPCPLCRSTDLRQSPHGGHICNQCVPQKEAHA